MYRAFDCYDDGARAPTPLPSGFVDGDEDEDGRMSEAWAVDGEGEDVFRGGGDGRLDGSGVGFASQTAGYMVRYDGLFQDRTDRQRLVGMMEGAVIASRYVYGVLGVLYFELN